MTHHPADPAGRGIIMPLRIGTHGKAVLVQGHRGDAMKTAAPSQPKDTAYDRLPAYRKPPAKPSSLLSMVPRVSFRAVGGNPSLMYTSERKLQAAEDAAPHVGSPEDFNQGIGAHLRSGMGAAGQAVSMVLLGESHEAKVSLMATMSAIGAALTQGLPVTFLVEATPKQLEKFIDHARELGRMLKRESLERPGSEAAFLSDLILQPESPSNDGSLRSQAMAYKMAVFKVYVAQKAGARIAGFETSLKQGLGNIVSRETAMKGEIRKEVDAAKGLVIVNTGATHFAEIHKDFAEALPMTAVASWEAGKMTNKYRLPLERERYSYALAHPDVRTVVGTLELENGNLNLVDLVHQQAGIDLLMRSSGRRSTRSRHGTAESDSRIHGSGRRNSEQAARPLAQTRDTNRRQSSDAQRTSVDRTRPAPQENAAAPTISAAAIEHRNQAERTERHRRKVSLDASRSKTLPKRPD
jgi:hypothetical protein